jgi:uncharacterized protein (DUF1810 family)
METDTILTDDPFNLRRFVSAQEDAFAQALLEVQSGQKRTHWMWYIFPQIRGLGHSFMSQKYSISGIPEAQAYLDHPILGHRLILISEAVMSVKHRSAQDIFGAVDEKKLKSCATLFAHAPNSHPVFNQIISKYFEGFYDQATIELLR